MKIPINILICNNNFTAPSYFQSSPPISELARRTILTDLVPCLWHEGATSAMALTIVGMRIGEDPDAVRLDGPALQSVSIAETGGAN